MKILKDFRELERSVRWFRGLSAKQVSACDHLLHALRDDIEQDSTYRVRDCLNLLGLQPMINANQSRVLMGISQGNDLAFLWFLWESHYKTPHSCQEERNKYTVNEQLIFTAIAHLDMTSTLRGLDKILPTAEHSKKYQEQQRLRQQQKLARQLRRKMQMNNHIWPNDAAKDSPYLVPQLRPKLYLPRSFKPKERSVSFSQYEQYRDPMYNIPNESSRWFATYELSPIKREVKRCLSDALAQLFASSSVRPLDRSLCQVHRMIEHTSARKRQELTVEAVRRCMQLLDVPGTQKRQRADCIVRQLEREVLLAAKLLREHNMRQLIALQQVGIDYKKCRGGCQACEQMVSVVPLPRNGTGCPIDVALILPEDSDRPEQPLLHDDDNNSGVHVMEWGHEKKHKTIRIVEDRNKPPGQTCSGPKVRSPQLPKAQPKADKKINVHIEDKSILTKTSEEKYCVSRSLPHGMPEWNFFKVFEPPLQSDTLGVLSDAQPLIHSYCIAALQKAIEASEETEAHKVYGRKHMDLVRLREWNTSRTALEAANKVAAHMFRDAQEKLTHYVDQEKSDKTERLEMTNIDPENSQMLMALLKQAVDILKNDAHYVLATLPNAYKLPVLLDWVAERYGKTYSYKQMCALANTSQTVHEHLTREAMKRELPLPKYHKFIGRQLLNEDLSHYRRYMCGFKKMRQEYHQRLNTIALEESRLAWLALRGFTQLPGSNPKTFFAYMPAKQQDLLRHNLWQALDVRRIEKLRQYAKERKLAGTV